MTRHPNASWRQTLLGLVTLAGLAGCNNGQPAAESKAGVSAEKFAGSILATALPPPTPQGETLFRRLSVQETGIAFSNTLARENQRNFTFNGAGVASGDYDGDGLVDLYLVTEEGQSKLYRNLGGMKFADVTKAAGIQQHPDGFAIGASFADFDNDDDLDLFLTNWQVPNQLYRNDGDGSFTDIAEQAGVNYVGGPTTATWADYDRDGDLDVFVATYRPDDFAATHGTPKLTMKDGKIAIPEELQSAVELVETEKGLSVRQLGEADLLYRNNGDGTFSEVSEAAGIVGGYWGLSASFSDYDNDGWPDLYVTNDFWSPDTFYHNNGDGSFSLVDASKIQQTPMFSMGMDFGDINNDGLVDYFVGDMLSRDATLRLTQHGLMDTTLPPDEAAAQVMHNALYLNNGDGSFSEIAWMAGVAASEWTWSSKFADVDLDGNLDLLITNGMIGDLMDSDVLASTHLPQFKNAPAYFDQYPRLATPDVAFRNNGDLSFTEVGAQWGLNVASIGHGATLADLDNDGDPDLVVNYMNEPVGIFRNDAQKHRIVIRLRGLRSNSQGLGARIRVTDANGQTQTRIMTSSGGYLSSHAPALVFGLDEQDSVASIEIDWPSGQHQFFAASDGHALPANHHYLITEPQGPASIPPATPNRPGTPQFVEVGRTAGLNTPHMEAPFDDNQYEGYDDFAEQLLLPRRLSAIGPGLSWADIDRDGDDDLYVAGGEGQAGSLFFNQGDGHFSTATNHYIPAGAEELHTLWLSNGSFISSLSRYEDPRLPTAAITAAASSTPIVSAASGGALALGDIDGDGDLDLFIGGRAIPKQWPLPASSLLYLNQGSAGFVDATERLAPQLQALGLATGAIWLDIDNDADSDLLVATEYGPVRLFLNDGGRLLDATETSGLDRWHGLWSGLAAGDFNHDGFMDFAAANWGLNTRYSASEQYPAMLYAGDIDADGDAEVEIVEAEFVDGVLRPLRERGMVGTQTPFVYEQFTTFRAYAEASLDEIYGDRLKAALTLYANTLEHSVFLNDGQGHFVATPLPQEAQATTGYGISAADFDNDGHDDLFIAGNFSHMDHEFRQFSGGTGYWLKNRGDGSFETIPSVKSGLHVPYDARATAVSDYDQDGWVDIAVGINDGPPMLLRNRGNSHHCSLRLQLFDHAENWHAVGARIAVTPLGGQTTHRQIQLGNGYFAQDSMVQLFGLGAAKKADVQIRWPDGTLSEKMRLGCGPAQIRRQRTKVKAR